MPSTQTPPPTSDDPMPIFLISHLLFTLTVANLLTASFSQSTTNCNRTFSCGDITDVTYPFTGGDRPFYCGPPEFQLSCHENRIAELTHNGVTYRILQHDPAQHNLILSRSDLYDNLCPSEFRNTTLNLTLFNSILPKNEILNLFYGCNTTNSRPFDPNNFFRCDSNGLNYTDSYHIIGPVPSDPILRIISCSESIYVPILRSAVDLLTNSSLNIVEVLMEGFSVNYSVPFEGLCSECNRLGGECGFNSDLYQFVCMCNNSPCPFVLTLPPQSSPNGFQGNLSTRNRRQMRMQMQIGLWIAGAVVAGVGLGWLIFCLRQRKKQRLATKSALILTKEISPSFSSKRFLTSSSAAFTKSIPSYPSSDSDLIRRDSHSSYFGAQIFDYAELQEATDNFNASRELGDGGFGTVYYGELHDGRKVAVKRLYENNFRRVEQFMNEVEILTRLSHQNLVKLYGCTSRQSRELLLVYEYIKNGTVADHLHGNRAKSRLLSWPIRLNIAIETAEALSYLHKSDIIHRDVKTTNILLANDFHVKVADFGLSRLFPTNVTHVSTAPQGTPGYVDPEYYQCYHLTEKSDVYSFGVILIELISSLQAVDTSRHRHDINLSNMAINKIQNHALDELVDPSLGFEMNSIAKRMATLVAELAFLCLQQERDMRPSMDEVLEGLKGIRDEDMNECKVDILMGDDDDVEPLNGVVGPPLSDSSSAPHSSG